MNSLSVRLQIAAIAAIGAIINCYAIAGESHAQGVGLFSPLEISRSAQVLSSGPSPAPPVPTTASGITTVRDRLVRVAATQLANARADIDAGTPARLTLNLFEDVVLQATFQETLPTWSGGYSLLGHLDGDEFATVALVVNGADMNGTVRTTQGTYEIEAVDGGVHVIRHVDLSALPSMEDDAVDPPPGTVETVPNAGDPSPPYSTAADDGTRIDVMVLYTPTARNDVGDHGRIIDKIEMSVADTNAAYLRSGVTQRIQLVFVEDSGAYLTEATTTDATLDALIADGTVSWLRDLYRADLVHLVVKNGIRTARNDEVCGQARQSGFAGLTLADCLSPGLTFAHELGHNMSISHDPYANDNAKPEPRPPTYSYGQGYVRIESDLASSWRTDHGRTPSMPRHVRHHIHLRAGEHLLESAKSLPRRFIRDHGKQ